MAEDVCPNCKGDGWVYEEDETIPFGDGSKRLGPGVLCPVCMGGIAYADPENERRKLAQRRPPNAESAAPAKSGS